MKKISVIVPVYNVEKYLGKCLGTLANQTLEDIEIIVVNDGTKDNSQKIIDKYCKKYPKIFKCVVKENGGQGSARNLGLALATGEYIAYVDSDDYVEKNMFELLYETAIKNDSDIVICGNHVVNEKYEIIKDEIYKNEKLIFSVDSSPNVLFDKMAVWNKIYKTDFLKGLKLEFRSKKWYEDFDFSVIALINAKKISVVEEPLYYYVLRNGSTMINSNIDRNIEITEAFDNILQYAKKNDLFNKYFYEFEFLAITHIYIYSIVRISISKASYKKKIVNIKKIKKYVKLNFNNFKKNLYIKTQLSLSRRIVYYLINYNLYSIIYILFKFKNRKMGMR